MHPKLSKSSIAMYLTCPKSYWFARRVHAKTDYPRLLGVTVHRFIAHLYDGKTNPLYYESLKTARNAWFHAWRKALEKNRHLIRFTNEEQEKKSGVAGWFCILNYWKQNIKKPRPIEIEKRYEIPLSSGFRFTGVLDQVRKTTIEVIKTIRPELVVEGKLAEGYAPVLIVDHKTGLGSWDLRRFEPNATLLEKAAFQFELHDDVQVTAYWWLYHKTHGVKPVGFYWYHLRNGEYFFTYRTEEDYKTLFEILDYVMSGLIAEKFPMHSGPHCKRCDYFEVCNAVKGGRPLLYSRPSKSIGEEESQTVEPKVVVKRAQQLRLKLKVSKVVRTQQITDTVDREENPQPQEESERVQTDPQVERLQKFLVDDEGENPVVVTLPSLDDGEGESNDMLSTRY